MQFGLRPFSSAVFNATALAAVLCAFGELAHAQLPQRMPDVIDFESARIVRPRGLLVLAVGFGSGSIVCVVL